MAAGRKTASRLVLPLATACLLIACYGALIVPFASYMHNKPFVEKLGNLPRVEVLQAVSADQKQVVAEGLILKVLMYYGGLVGKEKSSQVHVPPDYMTMSRLLHGSVKLDPYNMDAYYFAQSILVWDVKQIKVANDLVEYGMKYRTWDWYLPFFAGFNYGYFLHDYPMAGKYYMKAGQLSGNGIFMSLASRYLNEAGQNDLAIAYLKTMAKTTMNKAVWVTLTTRLKALEAVKTIELARDAYQRATGHPPASIEQILYSGYLKELPKDPYGGSFYLDPDGKVKTTSKFLDPVKKK